MSNYFRITAYHPAENLSVIFDSNGYFEKLWQFSAYLIQKGFKIIEVGNEEKFDEGETQPLWSNLASKACVWYSMLYILLICSLTFE